MSSKRDPIMGIDSGVTSWRQRIVSRVGLCGISLLAVVGACIWLVGRLAGASGPVICRSPVVDLGEMRQNNLDPLRREFVLENVTRHPIRVKQITSDCGCVAAARALDTLEPGVPVALPVTIQPGNKPGPFEKHVRVALETAPEATVVLTIVGMIGPSAALYSVPQRIDFGAVRRGDVAVRTIKLARYEGSRVHFLNGISNCEGVTVGTGKSGDAADSFVDVEVRFDSASAAVGRLSSSIHVRTDHPVYPDIKIPVICTVVEPPSAFVQSLTIDRLMRGGVCERRLAESGGSGVTVRELLYDGPPALKAELVLRPGDPNEADVPIVRLTRIGADDGPAPVRGSLLLTVPDRPEAVRVALTVFLGD